MRFFGTPLHAVHGNQALENPTVSISGIRAFTLGGSAQVTTWQIEEGLTCSKNPKNVLRQEEDCCESLWFSVANSFT
jgi:hypothetical protein